MRTLERDKKPLYVCHKIQNSEPPQFEEPVLRKLNTVATVSQADIVAFGEQYKQYRRAIVSRSVMDQYHEGDRAYIYTQPPMVHDRLCNGCDFEIVSVSDSISQVEILFKRLQIGEN